MGKFERKVNRDKVKTEIKKSKIKKLYPLSKYKLRPQEEIKQEVREKYAEQLVKHMMNTAIKAENKEENNLEDGE